MGIEKSQPKTINIQGMTQQEVDFLFIETAKCLSKFCAHLLGNKPLLNGILNETGISYEDFILNAFKIKTISELNGGQ